MQNAVHCADVVAVVVIVASNKPNPAQIMDKLNNVDGSHACESCYGKRAFENHDKQVGEVRAIFKGVTVQSSKTLGIFSCDKSIKTYLLLPSCKCRHCT